VPAAIPRCSGAGRDPELCGGALDIGVEASASSSTTSPTPCSRPMQPIASPTGPRRPSVFSATRPPKRWAARSKSCCHTGWLRALPRTIHRHAGKGPDLARHGHRSGARRSRDLDRVDGRAHPDGGQVVGSVSVARDVTATVEAQQRLADQERFVEAILGATEALVIVLDPQGRVERFNGACEAPDRVRRGACRWPRVLGSAAPSARSRMCGPC